MNCRIRQAIDDFLSTHDHAATGDIVVAFSGGLDSTVLLHALAMQPTAISRRLRAVHVDHQLQTDSAHWAEHCVATAAALQIAIAVIKVDVVDVARFGPEGAARRARHAAFASTLSAGDLLLTAHHADDQAETFLLRALRAAGAEGLAAMRPLRAFGDARLGRPLLELPREALREYARRHQQSWIDDPSNAEAVADRNFLRLQVLPLIEQRWPKARRALAESARLLGANLPVLNAALDDALAHARSDHADRLRISVLLEHADDIASGLIRHWLRALDLPPAPPRVLTDVLQQLRHAAVDRNICVRWQGGELRRYRDQLHAMAAMAATSEFDLIWQLPAPLTLPDGRIMRIEGSVPARALRVRSRQDGATLRIADNRPERAVRLLFQELGIPPWERERMPYVYSDTQLLAVGSDILHHEFRHWLHAHKASLVIQPASTTSEHDD